jgi:hypothetical protein
MIVVSDASALINLARIGELGLLPQLYGEIVIPQAVWQEVVVEGAGQPGADAVGKASWISAKEVTNEHLVRALRQDLDAGEAEAIALALELEAHLLIMDERLGRQTAGHLGVRYLGLIGVLIAAKRASLIVAVRPRLDALRDKAGFRVSDALYRRILRDQGEGENSRQGEGASG